MYAVGFAAASRRSLFFSDYRLELSNDNDFMPLIRLLVYGVICLCSKTVHRGRKCHEMPVINYVKSAFI